MLGLRQRPLVPLLRSGSDSITGIDVAEKEDYEEVEKPRAELGSGQGRIIYIPLRRGKRIEIDSCRATNYKGTEGSFDRVVVT
ncbi:37S ribosomal S22, mitochondrial isoform X1 [Olea europaea subsp. europaea]|uniref:37S ribosomal S22, mitochondrial isoform X1 n=1 Tax=Olea europaea subsp. europaea TaxID=158383 RepID=A0A8S0V1D9_OLEEU|nr:37S ribosomal S22, mitochondrial isoform X1 [Olea europaea subsp. europaea]